jgi:hypothetical protein
MKVLGRPKPAFSLAAHMLAARCLTAQTGGHNANLGRRAPPAYCFGRAGRGVGRLCPDAMAGLGGWKGILRDRDVPEVHVVAKRIGDNPATLLKSYAKRTKKADASAANVIGTLTEVSFEYWDQIGTHRPHVQGVFSSRSAHASSHGKPVFIGVSGQKSGLSAVGRWASFSEK